MARGRVRLLAASAALSVVVAALVGTGSAEAADASNCGSFDKAETQLINPTTDTNLLTHSPGEILSAAARYGYTEDNGHIAKVATEPETGLTAIWRLWRKGDFVFAAEGEDVDDLVASGYSKLLIQFYASTNAVDCLVPIERLKRDGKHRMAKQSDVDEFVADGWQRDKTAFFAGAATTTEPNEPPAGDTKFSIAVIPDTQVEVVRASDTRFENRVDWLAANRTNLDLRYVFQIGDLVNWGHVAPEQFEKVSDEVKPLEAVVPWAGAIGNHDTAAVCAGGGACPGANTSVTVRNTSAYNRYFPVSRFENVGGTYEAGKIDNAYHTYEAGGVKWLALTLELWPRAGAVSWAKDVVRDHPDHNVIIVTHHYLEGDGSIGQDDGGYGATSPQYLYDNLIKLYPNVKLVLSGHTGQADARTDVGVNGNKILSLLQTYHSSTNPVRLVEIDTAVGTVTSKVYAPYTKMEYPQHVTSTSGLRFN